MNIPDLTPTQDAAFVSLRRLHNRDNPSDHVTKSQLVERYANTAFQEAVKEANLRVNDLEIRRGFAAASPGVKAQILALLGQ